MTEPLEFVAVTTQSRRRRHWSLPPAPRRRRLSTLCGVGLWVFDQDHPDLRCLRPTVVIADLPPCLQCDKSRKRREEGRKT